MSLGKRLKNSLNIGSFVFLFRLKPTVEGKYVLVCWTLLNANYSWTSMQMCSQAHINKSLFGSFQITRQDIKREGWQIN